jgi:hypothetical protein
MSNNHYYFNLAVIALFITFFLMLNNLQAQEIPSVKDSVTQTTISDKATIKQDDEPALRFVEEFPEFVGGMDAMHQFIQENNKYPADNTKGKISAQVFVEFIIEKDGTISNAKILAGAKPRIRCRSIAFG